MIDSKNVEGFNTNTKILVGSILVFMLLGALSTFIVPWKSDFKGTSDYISNALILGLLGFILGLVFGIILILLKKYIRFKNNNIFNKVINILSSPRKFFDKSLKEKGIKQSFTYYFILSIIILPLYLVSQYYILQKSKPEIISSILSLAIVILAIKYLINISIGVFVGASVFHHIFVKNFGGTEGFNKTFQAIAYGMTPLILLEWVPYVNILAAIYASVLTIIGISKLQKIDIKKTTLIYLIFIIISAIITYGIQYFSSRH